MPDAETTSELKTFSISKFAITDRPENSTLIRLSKSDASAPYFTSIEIHKSEQTIISDNRFKRKVQIEAEKTPPEKEEELQSSPKNLSGFGNSFSDFTRGAFQIVSGAEMLRYEMELTISAMFHVQSESFLASNGAKIGKQREMYAWYALSDKKLSEFRSLMDRRMEKNKFIRNLPAMLIPALVSHFDAFILRTINDILESKPQIARSIDKTITVQELLEYPSIEVARAAIVDKEINNIMRDSHDKHLKWISEKAGVEIKPDETLKKAFFELCERRNILIHNDGRVNNTYLEKCEKHGVDISGLNDGDSLTTDAEYLSQAISCIFEMATKISQAVWRKTSPSEIGRADSALNEFTYELICRKKYNLAIRLFEFCRDYIKPWSSEKFRLQNLINHANALRLSGDRDAASSLIKSEDWESRSPQFQLCAQAVLEEFETCSRLLIKHGPSIEIDRMSFVEWPVFIGLREDPEFQMAFEEVFGESLIDDILQDAAASSDR